MEEPAERNLPEKERALILHQGELMKNRADLNTKGFCHILVLIPVYLEQLQVWIVATDLTKLQWKQAAKLSPALPQSFQVCMLPLHCCKSTVLSTEDYLWKQGSASMTPLGIEVDEHQIVPRVRLQVKDAQ